MAVGNVLQNNNLHLKQALSDLNAESLYNPLLKRGYNEFWQNGILANNGLFAPVAVSLDSKPYSCIKFPMIFRNKSFGGKISMAKRFLVFFLDVTIGEI